MSVIPFDVSAIIRFGVLINRKCFSRFDAFFGFTSLIDTTPFGPGFDLHLSTVFFFSHKI